MRILNLFAGIGGNRTLWGDSHDITAVEFDPAIAAIYQQRFPTDMVVVGDAYEYLEQHFDEFEFIWASPPCTTHSKLNLFAQNIRLPDLRVYSIIIFLDRWHKGKWAVENVKPYYQPLIPITRDLGRHFFWANFYIPAHRFPQPQGTLKDLALPKLKDWHGITEDVTRQQLRNCVDCRSGKFILDRAIKPKQTRLFQEGGA